MSSSGRNAVKAVFIHDHCFAVPPSGVVYSPGKLAYGAWGRYLKVFDALTVVGRSRAISAEEARTMNMSSGSRVSFVFVPNLTRSMLGVRHVSEVRRILKQQIESADAVIVRTSLLGTWAAALARKQRRPCAVEVVGDAWDAYWHYGSVTGKLYAPVAWWIMRRCLRQASFAIYVTREFLQRRYPCPGVCAYASNAELRPVPDSVLSQRLAKPWPPAIKTSARPKVGMIGSLANRHKGLDVALRALRRLKDRGILLNLHVLGAGRLEAGRQMAKQLGVAELLHLDGSLPSGDPVIQWLDDLDVYIQPSLTEGLPRALIEAMSRGLPALASTCGGIPELLPKDCLHRPGDDRALAAHLLKMTEDSTWRQECATRNFYESKQYGIDAIAIRRDAFWSLFAAQAQGDLV